MRRPAAVWVRHFTATAATSPCAFPLRWAIEAAGARHSPWSAGDWPGMRTTYQPAATPMATASARAVRRERDKIGMKRICRVFAQASSDQRTQRPVRPSRSGGSAQMSAFAAQGCLSHRFADVVMVRPSFGASDVVQPRVLPHPPDGGRSVLGLSACGRRGALEAPPDPNAAAGAAGG